MFMEVLLTALEIRLRQTERTLVVERLALQTAEVAQQTLGTWPAGVDAEEIGTLPMFTGDVDLSEQTDSVPWSQRSLTIRSCFGKFNRTTAWMLQQVETSADDPIIIDNSVMTKAEQRFSAQAYCVLILTCRGKALQVVQRVPRGFGFAWKKLYEEFEPRPPVKSQEMRQALLSPAKSDESGYGCSVSKSTDRRSVRNSRATKCRSCRKTNGLGSSLPGSGWVPPSRTDVQDVWKHGSHRGIVR